MRATRAYIASAGTATVMLVASLALFGLVSTLVAFGSWPGVGAGAQLDQVLLNDVVQAKPKPIAVSADGVADSSRADASPAITTHAGKQRAQTRAVARTRSGKPVAQAPRGSTRPGSAPAGSPAAAGAPAASGTPVAQVPTDAAPAPVKQGVDNVTNTVNNTVQQVAGQVTQPVQNVTDEVGQVVDQVAAPVQQTAAPVVQQVQDTAGNVLPH